MYEAIRTKSLLLNSLTYMRHGRVNGMKQHPEQEESIGTSLNVATSIRHKKSYHFDTISCNSQFTGHGKETQ